MNEIVLKPFKVKKKKLTLTVDEELVKTAKILGINLSATFEKMLRQAILKEQEH